MTLKSVSCASECIKKTFYIFDIFDIFAIWTPDFVTVRVGAALMEPYLNQCLSAVVTAGSQNK